MVEQKLQDIVDLKRGKCGRLQILFKVRNVRIEFGWVGGSENQNVEEKCMHS